MVGRRLVAASSASRPRCSRNMVSPMTRSAPAFARVMAAKALSNASGPRASTRCSWTPNAWAALSASRRRAWAGRVGFQRTGHPGDGGEHVLEELQLFPDKFGGQEGQAG